VGGVKDIFKKLVSPEREMEFKVKALAAGIQATGVPKEQALIMARQKLEKTPNIVPTEIVPAQASIFTPTTLAITALLIFGAITLFAPKSKRRR